MRIIKAKDYNDMSLRAADILGAQLLLKPRCVLGLATGGTPVGTYKQLIERCDRGLLSFSQATTVNLDEYVSLAGNDPNSYRYFMDDNLFSHVDIDRANTYVPDGLASDANSECARYDEIIARCGGIDLQLLGLGLNGHIGFNEPDDDFAPNTHKVALTQSTIDANRRFFESEDQVPRFAYTMGIGTILRARRILLIVSGKEKAAIVRDAFFGPVSPKVPASALQLHNDVTLVGDADALSLI